MSSHIPVDLKFNRFNERRPPRPTLYLIFVLLLVAIELPIRAIGVCLRRLFQKDNIPLKDDLVRTGLRRASRFRRAFLRWLTYPKIDKILNSRRCRELTPIDITPISNDKFSAFWIRLRNANLGQKNTTAPRAPITIFWIHGGAYVFGHPLGELSAKLRIMEILASEGLVVNIFSLHYSCAPESKFPTQMNEAVAAYQHLLLVEHIPATSIVLHGESAGGHLALCCLRQLACQGIQKPGGAMLLYPWVNLLNSGNSFRRNKFKDMLSRDSLNDCVDMLMGKQGDRAFPQFLDFSAALGGGISWASLLPQFTLVKIGTCDCFLDDVSAFHQNARADGADIALELAESKFHGWHALEDMQTEKRYCALESTHEVADDLMIGSQDLARGLSLVITKL